MSPSESKNAKGVSEMKSENKLDINVLESLDGTLDIRMMKAESHRLEKLFHEIDTNKDGRINAHELSEGLKRMGYCHISEEQVEVCLFITNEIREIKNFHRRVDIAIFIFNFQLFRSFFASQMLPYREI